MIRPLPLAAAVLAVALAACGSVTDSVKFNVPPRYESRASLGPFMQIWETPDKKSMMMLMAFPGQADVNKAMSDAKIDNSKVKKHERITICGNQQADFVQAEGATGTNVKLGMGAGETTKSNSNIDMLVTRANGKTYFAMYAWPLRDAADPQAEAAVRGVCSK